MARFYKMTANTNLEDLARPGEEILKIAAACQNSAFQFLDHAPLSLEISEDSGLVFPDFIYGDGVPLVSAAFKRVLDAQEVDNLFYKPIYLECAALGRHEPYILALPPRIRAVRQKYMRPMSEDESEGMELMKDDYGLSHYRINASAVGNYRIFKLADVWDDDIIVIDELAQALSQASLSNVYFSELEED